MRRIALTTLVIAALAGCQDYGPNQTIGTGVGAGSDIDGRHGSSITFVCDEAAGRKKGWLL